MPYYLELNKIDLNQFKNILKNADLLPSRMLLKENLEENFEILAGQNIKNALKLLTVLKSKKRIEELSIKTDIDTNYLNILSRELRSFQQKPPKLADFPETDKELIKKLESLSIKNALQLYECLNSEEDIDKLSKEIKHNKNEIHRLFKLTDLTRIKWVNHTFAYILYEVG